MPNNWFVAHEPFSALISIQHLKNIFQKPKSNNYRIINACFIKPIPDNCFVAHEPRRIKNNTLKCFKLYTDWIYKLVQSVLAYRRQVY